MPESSAQRYRSDYSNHFCFEYADVEQELNPVFEPDTVMVGRKQYLRIDTLLYFVHLKPDTRLSKRKQIQAIAHIYLLSLKGDTLFNINQLVTDSSLIRISYPHEQNKIKLSVQFETQYKRRNSRREFKHTYNYVMNVEVEQLTDPRMRYWQLCPTRCYWRYSNTPLNSRISPYPINDFIIERSLEYIRLLAFNFGKNNRDLSRVHNGRLFINLMIH